jgi:hypothetical protein
MSDMANVEKDAKGQFAKSVADRKADGVASAKPTAVTSSEDATMNKTPPNKKPVKDWDPNYDPAGSDESKMR